MASILATGSPKRPLTGRHIVTMLIGFFAVIFAVNALFIYLALSSFSGVETDNAYQRGVAYNRELQREAAEARIGWQGTLAIADGRPVLTLIDHDGKPVLGAVVAGKVGRPSVDRFDKAVRFASAGDGHYVAETPALTAGAWIVVIDARDQGSSADKPSYRLKERLWVSR